MKSRITLVVISVLLLIFTAVVYEKNNTDDESRVIADVHYCIKDENRMKLIKDGQFLYAFIPSGIAMEEVSFSLRDNSITIDDSIVVDGESFAELGIDDGGTYKMVFDGRTYDFSVLCSGKVSTLLLTSATENFEEVFNDKKHKEPVSVRLLNENGDVDYLGIGDLRGRGNSTWKLDKKPFNLYINESESLLNMPASNKYCLLANGYDGSNIRNKLVFDFAKKVDSHWTPEGDYVDLYLNGQYYGLYLLTESIEVSEAKICVSQDKGYWFSMSIPSRIPLLDNYIVTKDGRICDIQYPEGKNYENLLEYLNRFEDGLKDGTGLKMIDVDSWANKYLIEEIFANTDIASMYFYCDFESEDNKIYAGPQWDYDNAIGNAALNRIEVPCTAQLLPQEKRFTNYGNTWYSELVNYQSFYCLIKEMYAFKYRPLLEKLLSYEIDELSERLDKASKCNYVRWSYMYDSYVENDSSEDIKNYIYDRVAFLDSLWLSEENWHSIRLNRGEGKSYLYYSVKHGEVFEELPNGGEIGIADFQYWIDEETGEEFLPGEIIENDRKLKAVSSLEESQVPNNSPMKIMKRAFKWGGIFVLIGLVMMTLIVIDYRRCKYGG